MRSRVAIIVNPAARKSTESRIDRACEILRQRGLTPDVFRTGAPGDAEVLARQASAGETGLIIAAGGDGTVNEVVNGIAGSEVPLAIVPLGTTNVLAKELAVPEDLAGALDRAVSGTVRRVSLGRIELSGSQPLNSRYFCLMASVGFDAQAVLNVNRQLKRLSGRGAYVMSGLRCLVRYSPAELEFEADGTSIRGYGAVIGKSSRYGGHFRVTPDARIETPNLFLCVFTRPGRLDLIRYVFGVVRGSHLAGEDVVYREADTVRVKGVSHVQIDGDYMGRTPAVIGVEKDALSLVW